MGHSKRFSVLRDPVHGDVYLTHEELRVLDTPEMQRLRGIKQLGTAYLVYPGAVHTRFDHSIGTVHVAQKMIEAIRLSFDLDPAGSLSISEEEARVIRISALLHDVAHIPHGHSIEDQDGLFERHDTPYRFQRLFDPARPLGQVLRELGVYEDVFSILTEPGTEGRREVPAYWAQLVGGTIAADILDYLARDAYFTGLRLEVDPRVTSYFKIDRASGNLYIDLAKHALLREDILSEIVRMLEARYYFSERVYYHHAKVCAGALVARAVEELVGTEALREEDLQDQTDASVLDVLDRAALDAGRETAERVLDLTDRVRTRRLYKRACVFPRYGNESAQDSLIERFFSPGARATRTQTETRITDLVRSATGRDVRVIIYCPARRMQLKEARIHVRWPGVEGVQPLSGFTDRVPRLSDLEESYRNLWKFYVFTDAEDPALLAKVQEIARGEFEDAHDGYEVGGAN